MAAKITRITGQQYQYLRERFGLDLIGGAEDGEFVARRDGRRLEVSTVAKMLGIDPDSPALEQEGNWVRCRI